MSLTKDFNNGNWFDTLEGDGSISTSEGGKVLSCSASTGLNRAYKKYYTIAMPGETVTFSCFARNKSEDGFTGYARLFIDDLNTTLADSVEIKCDDTTQYTVSLTIPTTSLPSRVFFGLGVYGSIEGSADFFEPTLHRSGGNVVMMGTLEFPDGGGCNIRQDFINYNIGTIRWVGSNQAWLLEPELPFEFSDTETTALDIQFKPHLSLSPSFEGNDNEVYTWYAGGVNNVGWIQIQACTMGVSPDYIPERVNLAAETNQTRFVQFKLEMVGN